MDAETFVARDTKSALEKVKAKLVPMHLFSQLTEMIQVSKSLRSVGRQR